jgi:hypothetical protein
MVGGEDHYNGQSKNGIAHGSGEMAYADGGVYVGLFVEGKRCGLGSMEYSSGATYDGEWENDRVHGKGTRKGIKFEYEGEWENGKRHGNGIMMFADGLVYEGEWENGKRHGNGIMKYADGDVYNGEWVNDEKSGKGTYKWSNGKEYKGEWSNGKKNGTGEGKYTDGRVLNVEWKDGKINGEGTLREANGDLFKRIYVEGELVSNKRCVSSLSSPRSCADDTVDVIVLDEYDTECQVCKNKFLTGMDTENENAKLRRPVIGTCQHVCCHGCLKEMACPSRHGGSAPQRIDCMECREKDAFCPSDPQFDRRLISLLSRSIPVSQRSYWLSWITAL